jgi:hypothetical protein
MDYNETIDRHFERIEKSLKFIKGAKLIIATGSNARSTAWHDSLTTNRGKQIEHFVASNQPHFRKEERILTTFQSSRGESNIDLTIAINEMIANVRDWDISEEESASDHNIIKFNISFDKFAGKALAAPGKRLSIRGQQHAKFYEIFQHTASAAFRIEAGGRSNEDLDDELYQKIKENTDVRKFTTELEEVIQKACRKTNGNKKM